MVGKREVGLGFGLGSSTKKRALTPELGYEETGPAATRLPIFHPEGSEAVGLHPSIASRDKGASTHLSGRNQVHIAPDPCLSRLNGAHERMLRMMEVFGCVLVLRRVATTNLPAFQAQPQMDPGVTGFHTFFTNMLFRAGNPDLIEMFTLRHLFLPPVLC